ncbi:MAG: hypothetical protein EOP51_21320, partial [Sphingobacteriales bacterium]
SVVNNKEHALPTLYRYNSLNQVVAQNTPDAGVSSFWYDRLGRLAISQNSKQRTANGTLNEANRRYSYTLYDEIGRITEVGEYTNTSSNTMTNALSRNNTDLFAWLGSAVNRREITRTIYDVPNSNWANINAWDLPLFAQNLRNRVAYTQYYPQGNATGTNYQHSSFYSYDIHGNVDTLVQDYGSYQVGTYRNIMNANGLHNRLKKTVYQYDLISGKVNHVAYQPQYRKGNNLIIPSDALYHKYEYDDENRLTAVHISTDSIVWEKDAAYDYYRHGPLARTELGEQRVQGLDYAYTLQGWLKGVNSVSLNAANDIGKDGQAGSVTGRDEFGFSLNYFNGDYSSIKGGAGTTSFPEHTQAAGVSNGLATSGYKPLYNGNISSMAVNIGKLTVPDASGSGSTAGAVLYNYTYDQLNRLAGMDAYKGLTAANNSWQNITGLDHYKERVSYDGNGNILTYKRNGNKTSQQTMDDLSYAYNYHSSGPLAGKLKNNQLRHVTDAVLNAAAYDEADPLSGVSDIESQAANNYLYDSIGNLLRDPSEYISSITWNVYGKISLINFSYRNNKVRNIYYSYDASGNRIGKIVQINGTSGNVDRADYTWYSRDASGNVMAVYTSTGPGTALPVTSLTVTERHLYGSSRLGILSERKDARILPTQNAGLPYLSNFIRGNKIFELSNHLGNVLATVSDKKTGVAKPSPDQDQVDYYVGEVVSANDYYPFGMIQPGRTFSAGSGYRYGFNGKENDKEVKGEGNQQDYGMRIYDGRIGKFLSVDPLEKEYPMLTPYQYASGNPIQNIDIDGLEGAAANGANTNTEAPAGSLEFLKGKRQNYDNARWIGWPGSTKQSIFAQNVVTSAWNQGVSAVESSPETLNYITSKHSKQENFEMLIKLTMKAVRWWNSDPFQRVETYEDIGGAILLNRGLNIGIAKVTQKLSGNLSAQSKGKLTWRQGLSYEDAIELKLNKGGINTYGRFTLKSVVGSREFDGGFANFVYEAKSGNALINKKFNFAKFKSDMG